MPITRQDMVQAQRMGVAMVQSHSRGVDAGKRAAALALDPLVEALHAELLKAHADWKPTMPLAKAWADLQTQLSILRGDV